MTSLIAETLAVVQQPPGSEDPGGRGADFGKSSPLGLLILILFIIAVAFLARSMTKHLKRVPPSFEPAEKDAEPAGGPADSAEPTGTTEDDETSERSENAGGKQGLSS